MSFLNLKNNMFAKTEVPFTHCWEEYNFDPRITNFDDYDKGMLPGRYYVVPDVGAYPSATTILGWIANESGDNDWLQAWRDRVGEEEANRISKEATTRGTNMHDMCEAYMRNKEVSPWHMLAYSLFKELKPLLDKVDNIRCLEHALYSQNLRVAGRVDCIGDYDESYVRGISKDHCGALTLIDFKSSRREKESSDIHGYYRQICIYAYCFKEMTGQTIFTGEILMGIDTMKATGKPGKRNYSVIIPQYMEETITYISKFYDSHGLPLDKSVDELVNFYYN